ncbi:hypothetical protein [Streptomyces sp. NPDC002078]
MIEPARKNAVTISVQPVSSSRDGLAAICRTAALVSPDAIDALTA